MCILRRAIEKIIETVIWFNNIGRCKRCIFYDFHDRHKNPKARKVRSPNQQHHRSFRHRFLLSSFLRLLFLFLLRTPLQLQPKMIVPIPVFGIFYEFLSDWDLPMLEAVLQLWPCLLSIQEIVRPTVSWWKHPFYQKFHFQLYYFRRAMLNADLVMLKCYQYNHRLV